MLTQASKVNTWLMIAKLTQIRVAKLTQASKVNLGSSKVNHKVAKLTHDQGSHSTSQPSSAMKMDLDHCMKTMKIQSCPKNMKTEISGQNFRLRRAKQSKILACNGQNSQNSRLQRAKQSKIIACGGQNSQKSVRCKWFFEKSPPILKKCQFWGD